MHTKLNKKFYVNSKYWANLQKPIRGKDSNILQLTASPDCIMPISFFQSMHFTLKINQL